MNRLAANSPVRRVKPMWLVAFVAVLGIAATACFPKQGTYPIEIFTEMHYSQAFRSQEPPRLPAVVGAQVFVSHPSEQTLVIPEKQKRAYDPAVAAELYRVNCSACHGVNGTGDGAIVPFLTSPELTRDGTAYAAPPNLIDSREVRVEDVVFSLMSNGINVMPRFDLLLTEEERWDLVAYIFDTENGLGR